MEAMLVTQLAFAACDTPSLRTALLQDANKVASDHNLSPVITAAVAAALQQNFVLKAMIWL
jgi:hypothetical protein